MSLYANATPLLGWSHGDSDNILLRKLLAIQGALISSGTSTPSETSIGQTVRVAGQITWRTTFSKVIASGVDSDYFTLLQTGAGQAVSQSAGNLVLTSGTTTNSETILRSNVAWTDSFNLRAAVQLSQRIANNNFFVEMVDVIGDGLAYTINSTVSVTVTFSGTNPFTSANVGQSMYLGAITGAAGVPNRYAIASVSGQTVTFTVVAWPATGSGTLSLFGWNYHHILYDGTTATANKYDAQRKGWNSGDTTTAINTTAAPGHISQLFNDDGTAVYSDSLSASTLTPGFVVRATRLQSLPGIEVGLYLQIRSLNGTVAPATTTTLTVGFVSIEDFAPVPVAIQAGKFNGAAAAPVVAQLSQINSTALLTGNGTTGTGSLRVTLASDNTANSNPFLVTVVPSAAQGNGTPHHLVAAATTNATSVKASAGTIGVLVLANPSAAVKFFKLFNKASAPTVGTDTPVYTFAIPAGQTLSIPCGQGLRLSTGIAYAITNLCPDLDSTAVTAGDVIVSFNYT